MQCYKAEKAHTALVASWLQNGEEAEPMNGTNTEVKA